MSSFYSLKIIDIKNETKDAVVISFDILQNLYKTFNYKAGQYLTLRFTIHDEEVRRSYSLCSSPATKEPLRIGVKRVNDGLVSNYIHDHLKVGDVVDVLPPDGRFYVDVKAENYKTYYLFTAGSGITPMLSILTTVLMTEERSYVHMIYGNRDQDSIMFKDTLEQLQGKYPDRFTLVHTLSRPKSNWSDLWKTSSEQSFRKGRLDTAAVQWFINEFPPYAQNTAYFICGPGTMITNTKKTLQNIDVPEKRIHTENFGGNIIKDTTEGFENATLITHLNGDKIELTVPKGKTILRTLIKAGKEPPYSCEGGVCSTCVCRLKNGKVHMKNNLALPEKEVEQGYILSCQSIPLTERVEVVYE